LRLATSRLLPADEALDGETAAMRDSFLALGGALDAAAGSLDEATLIAQLQAKLQPPDQAAPLPPVRTKTKLQAAFSIALALAALVAIVRIAAPPVATSPPGQVVVEQPPASQPSAIVRVPGNIEAAPPPRGWWFDPLDDEIALAQAEFQRLNADSRSVDGSLSNMNERLEALSQELFQGSL
jgi:hypothetical protein